MTTTYKKLAFIACLALVLSCAGVCYGESSLPVELPSVTGNTYAALVSEGLQLDSGSWYSLYAGRPSELTSSLFVGCVYDSSINQYQTYFATSDASQYVRYNNSASSTTVLSLNVQDSTSGLYYKGLGFRPNLPTANNPIFPSLDDFLNAVANPFVGEVIDFSIPAGYAFVIDGECEVLERSYYINNSWNFTTSDNRRVNGSIERKLGSSSIRDGFSPDRLRPRSELIQWEALNPNIFGKASNYEYYNGDLLTVGTGEVFLISYPTLYGYGTADSNITYQNAVNMVCSVYIQYINRPSFRFVALESLSEFSNSGSFSTYSVFRPDVADVEGDSSQGSGGTVISPESSLPSDGGNNGQPSVNDDNSQLGTISKLVNDIKSLFSNAVEGITELVNSGSSFMQSIGAMFTWLPSPVLTVIIAGFTILLVVGVLKVLWR